jgi:hypothetical protein
MAEQQPEPIDTLMTAQLNRSTETIAILGANLAVSTAAIVASVKAMRSGQIKKAEQILMRAAQQIAASPLPPAA